MEKRSTIRNEYEGKEFLIENERGRHSMKVYEIFSGVTFIFHEAHIQSIYFKERKNTSDEVIEITHCREGRLECHIGDEYCYMEPGDLAIARTNSVSGETYFPLRHYHGVTIQIDLNVAPKSLVDIMADVDYEPKKIADKFCSKKGGSITRANASIEHIFSEIYTVPKEIRKAYFKVKGFELFLFLSVLEIEEEIQKERVYTQSQVEFAKKISQYMLEHMEEKITLEQLEEVFHVSSTYIKNAFKGVYGVSIAAYIRALKMESAAYMLEYTNKSIIEIANLHGYENGSKFSGAFRAVKGVNPAEYRKNIGKQS